MASSKKEKNKETLKRGRRDRYETGGIPKDPRKKKTPIANLIRQFL